MPLQNTRKKSSRHVNWQFHPLELAVCGLSGTGKTTLLSSLLATFSQTYEVGYLKHDTHRFQMDQPGKDSWKAAHAGASTVGITSPTESALRHFRPWSPAMGRQAFAACDFLLLEGWKQDAGLDKILLIDGLDSLEPYKRVCACVSAGPREAARSRMSNNGWEDLPLFHRDQLEEIGAWILSHFQKQLARRPLKGLLLAGGHSRRMGQDKALLQVEGETMLERSAGLLGRHCPEMLLSVRPDQVAERQASGLPLLADRYLDKGPMGGLLSAMEHDPAAAWLVLGCDLPKMNDQALQDLVRQRRPFSCATAYISPEDGKPEPLCAIWEPQSRLHLLQGLLTGRHSLRAVLLDNPGKLVEAAEPECLFNMNRPEDLGTLRRG